MASEANIDDGILKGLGLRERKKIRCRAAIMDAGHALFSENGYSGTSMDAIAERADVGIATVYNYFGTKGRLLADIQTPQLEKLLQDGVLLLKSPPEEPCEGMLALIGIYRSLDNNWAEKALLLAVIAPGLAAEPLLDELAQQAEEQVKLQIEDMIAHYQASGRVRADINLHDAASIIFYIFNQHFIEHVTQDSSNYQLMAQQMDRQIGFIIGAISA